jgi:hypothetical protein
MHITTYIENIWKSSHTTSKLGTHTLQIGWGGREAHAWSNAVYSSIRDVHILCTRGWLPGTLLDSGSFAERRDPLGEGPFPLVEGFAERKLSVKATRWSPAGEAGFTESAIGSSRWTCAERRPWLSPKTLLPSRHIPPLGVGAILRWEPNIWLLLKKGSSPRAKYLALVEGVLFAESCAFYSRRRSVHPTVLGAPFAESSGFCSRRRIFSLFFFFFYFSSSLEYSHKSHISS